MVDFFKSYKIYKFFCRFEVRLGIICGIVMVMKFLIIWLELGLNYEILIFYFVDLVLRVEFL